MKRIICMETSLSLSDSIAKEFNKRQIEVECYSKAVEGIIEIHKNPPDLIIISSILKDLRGADALEYLKDNIVLKQIPIIMYSTVTNPMNDIYFKSANIFIKRDANFIETVTLNAIKLIQNQDLELPQSTIITQIEVFSAIDKIYYKRDILNKIILNLLEESFCLLSLEQTIHNCINIIGKNFSISSINYKTNNNQYKKEFKIQDGMNNDLHTIILNGIQNTSLTVIHYIDQSEELENFQIILDIVNTALGFNVSYTDNLEMSGRLNYLFKNFLPEQVVDDLLNKKSQKSLMTGEKREVAVIFSHIKHFNNIEENLSAKEVVEFLNRHFSGLSTNIKKYGGEINKFIGDALFAMVGAPLSFNNNEERAINAALDMTQFVKEQEEDYKIGIGIHIGKAIIGNIGSEDNFDYTAIGDTINLAARLESLCKYYHVNILVSNTVYNACIKDNSSIEFRQIDTVMVQGKDEPTTIYSVESLTDYPTDYIHTYNKGLKMFTLGNWHFAYDYFMACKKLVTLDRIVDIYIERCNKFINNPPINWTGAITLDFK